MLTRFSCVCVSYANTTNTLTAHTAFSVGVDVDEYTAKLRERGEDPEADAESAMPTLRATLNAIANTGIAFPDGTSLIGDALTPVEQKLSLMRVKELVGSYHTLIASAKEKGWYTEVQPQFEHRLARVGQILRHDMQLLKTQPVVEMGDEASDA